MDEFTFMIVGFLVIILSGAAWTLAMYLAQTSPKEQVKKIPGKIKQWIRKQTEFVIAFFAAVAWFAFWVASQLVGTETYPVGYFQKIAFGLLAMSIISGVTFYWLRRTQPYYADLLDPDTQGGIEKLTEWQKLKIGLFWFLFYGAGTVVLVALY